ncbi:hypothetical protein [Sphingobium sp. Sx8-8]|uniref:hypothetical protein n=1 Tax=Sphingobium sp. Sx8-8 TaxID=2933617 RepID=UPI001F563CE3|nr:hypothetical protein [Sphingobium sp. Sx8-8]
MTCNLELTEAALDDATRAIGDGPVVMVNLLKFRDTPDYPAGFADAKPDSRSGYYEGYVGGFRQACADIGITPDPVLVYAGSLVSGILAGPDDDWDEIVVVRYSGFEDLRRILANDLPTGASSPRAQSDHAATHKRGSASTTSSGLRFAPHVSISSTPCGALLERI